MDIEKLYETLDDEVSTESRRTNLEIFLKTTIKTLSKTDRRDFAYSVAGLLSTNYAQSLSRDDLMDRILTTAGEIEVSNDIDDFVWNEFCAMINSL